MGSAQFREHNNAVGPAIQESLDQARRTVGERALDPEATVHLLVRIEPLSVVDELRPHERSQERHYDSADEGSRMHDVWPLPDGLEEAGADTVQHVEQLGGPLRPLVVSEWHPADPVALKRRVDPLHLGSAREIRWFLEGRLVSENGVVRVLGNDAQLVYSARA